MALLRVCLAALVFFAGGATARAEDPTLTRLHAMLSAMRTGKANEAAQSTDDWVYAGPSRDLRYATPALTDAKHLLRDWIETQLAVLPHNGNERALAHEINRRLRRADLFCDRTQNSRDRCDIPKWYWNGIGFVYPEVTIERQPETGVLVVRAGLGVLCGTDTSAYVYEWRGNRWMRIWQGEQAIQSGVAYQPQGIEAVRVSPVDPQTGSRLVLSLGYMDWCSSAYYPVYFRLWRAYSNGSDPKLLLDIRQPAYVGDEPAVSGRVSLHDAFIEFDNSGFDPDVPYYSAVRHFRIDGDTVTRIEPFAFNPRSFVEEWLAADWSESQRFSSPEPALREWHRKFHALDHDVAFIERSQHCADSSLWQASLQLGPDDRPSGIAYFIIRWRPPDRFEMVSIDAVPRADCTGEGPAEREFAPLLPAWIQQ